MPANQLPRPWTPEREAMLRAMVAEKVPLKIMLRRLNELPAPSQFTSVYGVKIKMRSLGLRMLAAREAPTDLEAEDRREAFAMFTAGRNVRYVEAELSCGLNIATLWHAEWLSQRDRVERRVAAGQGVRV